MKALVRFGLSVLYCGVLAIAQSANAACTWESVAAKYPGLNPYLLHAIAVQESGLNPLAKSPPNKNGTVDIGLMQINSAWLPTLRSRFGITLEHLYQPCINLDVGAWILYENFRDLGFSWRAIGAYNARSEDKRLAYVRRVYRRLPPGLLPARAD
jgi:soluble lytic murein transglycosylase-like protein